MLVSRVIGLFLVVVCQVFVIGLAQANEIRVAVASNFLLPAKSLATQFEAQTGHRVVVSSGSSGRFYAQIRNGAPYDVFMSADADKPQRLIDEGFALAEHHATYAQGVLVLVAGSSLAEGTVASADFTVALKQGAFQKLALANPKLAPYGLAAQQVLEGLGDSAPPRSKWIQGENVSQAFQFVVSGNAELGFVAQSQVLVNDPPNNVIQPQGLKGFRVWVVPAHLYSPIKQSMVVLKKAADSAAAKSFFEFVLSDAVQAQIRQFGYR